MDELIPLTTTGGGVQAVLGRDLHDFLGVESRYNDWFARMIEYGFEEGADYATQKQVADANRGFVPGGNRIDHVISLDMAKEISMLQRTEKGKQARRYFLECERVARQKAAFKPQELSRMDLIQLAYGAEKDRQEEKKKRIEAERQAGVMRPKAEAYDTFLSDEGLYSVASVAKMLGVGPQRLFRHLRNTKVLLSDSKNRNLPYGQYTQYFASRPRSKTINGKIVRMNEVLVKPEGVDFIRRHLNRHPMI